MMEIKLYPNRPVPEEILALLLEADPSKERVKTYLPITELYLAKEKDLLIGLFVLFIDRDFLVAEILNISVAQAFQNQGYGTLLVKGAIEKCREQGVKELKLGTGNSSINQLYFYQKCGFEMTHILPNHFLEAYDEPIWENGIQCKHMVRFKMEITG